MTSVQLQSLLVQPNQFVLGGSDIGITYESTSIAGFPQLTYTDRSQTLNFRGKQVQLERTQLGQMVTVTLNRNVSGTGAIETLTLLIPTITLSSATKKAIIQTIAIFSLRSSLAKIPGQSQNYMTLCLSGEASQINF